MGKIPTSRFFVLGILSILGLSFAVQAVAAPAVKAKDPEKVTEQVSQAEPWKGSSPTNEVTLGAMAGLGIVDSFSGFTLVGTAAKKILDRGFVPDINNQVFIEAEVGPLFAHGGTTVFYSTHLRWDFIRDQEWTLFALGGFGGDITPEELGSNFEFFPRFGAGAFWQFSNSLDPMMKIRFEVSHELVGLGLSFSL